MSNTEKLSQKSTQETVEKSATSKPKKPASANLVAFLKPYTTYIAALAFLGLFVNGLALAIPKLTAVAIDGYTQSQSIPFVFLWILFAVVVGIFMLTIAQSVLSTYTSELVAKNVRSNLVASISQQSYGFINEKTPGKLLTNLTADINEIKTIISQGLITAVSALLTLVGAAIFLLTLNWQLALMALTIIPLVAVTFGLIFGRIGALFKRSQENLEKINRVITESILAASLIRVLNSQSSEQKKFGVVNATSKEIGTKIVNLFASLIPIITLLSNVATLGILWFGGQKVATGELSLGNFSAFFSYLGMLIFPIFMLGFIGSSFSRSLVSLGRIQEVLDSPTEKHTGEVVKPIQGDIEFRNVSLNLSNRSVLRNISFTIPAHSKTAIIGPTAAGKSQIFALLAGLVQPTSGEIFVDGIPLNEYSRNSFYSQVGLVFQDSIVFNTTLSENINFRKDNNLLESDVDHSNKPVDQDMQKAIHTSALDDLILALDNGLETEISERGSNLSGGQKQRLMLARALSINPKVLLLDDFTARVDIQTERQILANLDENYPGITLLSITQKIEPIVNFNSIFVIMEGELIASGTHEHLLKKSLEYQQIWESQQTVGED